MSRALILLTAALAGCAPAAAGGTSPATGAGPSRIGLGGGSVDIHIGAGASAASHTLAADPEQVWAALPGIYETIGIRDAAADAAQRSFGVESMIVRRRLGDERLSRYLDCGTTAGGAEAADHYRVRLSAITSVRPVASGGSEVRTEVSASGQNLDGTSTDQVRCASRGTLEARIAELLGAGA